MLFYINSILFVITVAIASASILISYQLKDKYKLELLSSLMYMQIFFFTFGFYAIWGQVLVNSLLSQHVSPELMSRILNILVYLGAPFLVFGWYMLIKFSKELTNRKNSNKFLVWFLVFNTLIFLGVGYYINKKSEFQPLAVIKYYYFILNFLYYLVGAFHLFFSKKSKIPAFHLKRISIAILTVVVCENLLIYFYNGSNLYLALIFIFWFFIGSGFISVYFKYQVELKPSSSNISDVSLDEFCNRHEITSREKEIILEIYNGLSNQQIADKLFISLQTVKDHTSRIYSKTNAQSRVQLIKIIQEYLKH